MPSLLEYLCEYVNLNFVIELLLPKLDLDSDSDSVRVGTSEELGWVGSPKVTTSLLSVGAMVILLLLCLRGYCQYVTNLFDTKLC